jgi:hypothetical protein
VQLPRGAAAANPRISPQHYDSTRLHATPYEFLNVSFFFALRCLNLFFSLSAASRQHPLFSTTFVAGQLVVLLNPRT